MTKEGIKMAQAIEMELKQANQLKDGDCVVVTERKKYNGFYNSEFGVVYFCIPDGEKIIGYIQED